MKYYVNLGEHSEGTEGRTTPDERIKMDLLFNFKQCLFGGGAHGFSPLHDDGVQKKEKAYVPDYTALMSVAQRAKAGQCMEDGEDLLAVNNIGKATE